MAEQDAKTNTTPEDRQVETPAEKPENKTNHLLESDGVDPDLKELEEAEAAVKAEEAAATVEGDKPSDAPAPEGEKPAGEDNQQKPDGEKNVTVPVAVAQEERHKRQTAEEVARRATTTALYWKNVAEGKLPLPGARAQEAEPETAVQPSEVKQRRQEIRNQIAALAEQVDDGKMSVKDFETQKGTLEDELDDLRETSLRAAIPKGNDLYLETLTKDLEGQNPWLSKVDDDEIQAMLPLARKDLVGSGYDLKAKAGTPEADYMLRRALVDRLKKHGFDGGEAATSSPANQKPNVNAKPTPAQVSEKQQLAADAPPQPKGAAAPADGWTPERVVDIDSVDLEKLPMRELNRILDSVDSQESSRRVNTASRK